MNRYIATFYSHYGAASYCRALEKQNITVKLMPAPRRLSSSCGTCAYFENDEAIAVDGCELDAVYMVKNNTFECVLKK
jgi:hypothetical protein